MSGGTGRTGLTIVGQVVGSYFGPIGAAVGGMIGSAIGGAIWPEQSEGPKLEGLQITSSAYGGPLSKVYGSYRVAGNVIWASEIREVARTEDAGKGGGMEITTYRYYADIAIGIAEGPAVGIRAIYADQKLIFNTGSDAASDIFTSYAFSVESISFYAGSEDQLPDPTIEAALGVGETPAFRGLSYVVLKNLDLSEYGNRTPNFNFEIVSGGDVLGPRWIFTETAFDTPFSSGFQGQVRLMRGAPELISISETAGGNARPGFISEPQGEDLRPFSVETVIAVPQQNSLPSLSDVTGIVWPERPGLRHESLLIDNIYTVAIPSTNNVMDDITLQTYILGSAEWAPLPGEYAYTGSDFSSVLSDGYKFITAIVPCADGAHVMSLVQPANTADPTAEATEWILFGWDGETFGEVDRGDIAPGTSFLRAGGAMRAADGGVQLFYGGMLESDLRHLWIGGSFGDMTRAYEIDTDGVMSLVANLNPPAWSNNFGTYSTFADNGVCWVTNDGDLYGFTRMPAPTGEVYLDEVVSDICEAAGLDTATDIDVTDLAGILVRGYYRTPRMSARAAIEPLMTSYAFDAVESDLKLKFVLRHATPAVTIGKYELGAGAGSGAEYLVESERAQESELPLSIDVTYAAADAGYQLGTQSYKRQAPSTVDVQSMRLPLAFQDQEAADIAARLVYELWTARNTRQWTTTVKFAGYEPTDVVTLETDSASYVVRITSKREAGNLLAFEGVDVDAAAFNPTNTATTVPGGQTVTPLPGLSQAVASDMPPLVEAHFGNTGYYAAGAGFVASWPGATLFRKAETSAVFAPELSFSTSATIGGAANALGAHGSTDENGNRVYAGYYPDHCNTLTVTLTAGTLASCTDEEFLQLANVALVGKEVIAFRDVDDLGDGQYELSCLLRGLSGTEWFASLVPATRDATIVVLPDESIVYYDVEDVQGHRVGDSFMLLDAAMVQHFDTQSLTSRIAGVTRTVTAGGTLGAATEYPLQQTYASIVQPHPTQIEAALNDDGDIDINFAPRTFIDGGWNDGRDAWLDPTHQEYIAELVNVDDESYRVVIALTGAPPHVLYAADWAAAYTGTGTALAIRVGATPKQMPGVNSEAFVSDPEMANRHYSRRVVVEIS